MHTGPESNTAADALGARAYTIHARHNQIGRNRRNLTAADPTKYGNREEEETIATGAGITENELRAEHGLDARVGHLISDKRP